MICILTLMTYLQQNVASQLQSFPLERECLNNFETDQQFLEYAQIDKEPTLKGEGMGVYQCYCMEQKES